MSDHLRQSRAIRKALTPGYPVEPRGRLAQHLVTLAARLSGLVASQSTQLPQVAANVPEGTQLESRVKRFSRWVGNDHLLEEAYCLP
jgi:hypothetical protein